MHVGRELHQKIGVRMNRGRELQQKIGPFFVFYRSLKMFLFIYGLKRIIRLNLIGHRARVVITISLTPLVTLFYNHVWGS
jgi:hypothetical protein